MSNNMEGRLEGTVVEYDKQGRYGFIQTRDLPDNHSQNEDVFFHISDVSTRGTPSQGWRFEFSLSKGEKGYRAEKLVKIGETETGDVETDNHSPGFDYDVDESANTRRLEQIEQKHDEDEEEEEEEEDSNQGNNPFEDDLRGSMNDLL